jgi:hypothetical protein
MNIKFRLTIMNFLEFFVWGAWLISMSQYMFNVLNFSGGYRWEVCMEQWGWPLCSHQPCSVL